MCGVFHNRSRFVMCLLFIPLFFALINTEHFFILVGFDAEASYYSQIYINRMIPSIFFAGLVDSNRRLLNSMGYQNQPMIIQLITLPLHILWCYLLTDYYDWGVKGTAIASSITSFTNFVLFWGFSSMMTKEKLRKESWFLPKNHTELKECINSKGLWEFVKLGLSSMGTICLEWWSFELMMLFSSYISVKATATQIVIMNTCSLCFMLPLGLQIAASVLVG